MRSFEKMVLDFIDILEKLEINYVIIGGIAVSSWGNPRTTRDLDVIVDLKMEELTNLLKNLKLSGFSVSKPDIEIAFKEQTHFTIFDEYSEYHID